MFNQQHNSISMKTRVLNYIIVFLKHFASKKNAFIIVLLLTKQYVVYAQNKYFNFTNDSLKNYWLEYVPELTGNIVLESKYTNFQSPQTFSERQYLRISTNQKLDVQGIRFGVTGFYTTENPSLYNSNYLKFYFDKPNLDELIRKQKNKLVTETKQNLQDIKYKQSKSLKENDLIEKQKTNLLNKIEERKSELKNELVIQLDSIEPKDTFCLKYGVDKQHLAKYQDKQDSLTDLQLRKLYSALNEIKNKQKQVDSINNVLKNQYKLDSLKLEDYKYSQLKNTEINSINKSDLNNKLNNLQKVFSKVEKLEIGNANPFIDPLSVYGLPIRGVFNSFNLSKIKIDWTLGLMPSIGIVKFDRNNTLFTRNLSAIKIEKKIKNFNLNSFGHFIWDNSNGSELIKYKNGIWGIGSYGAITKTTNIVSSVAVSNFSISQIILSERRTISTKDIPSQRFIDKLAYSFLISQNIYKNALVFELKSQRNGAVFRNLGNPFIRNQYLENSLKIKVVGFESQLLGTIFYKEYSSLSLPTSSNQYSFQNKGYGISLQSKFKRKELPNMVISYSPFEQGNNHPDTLLRVNSRSNLFNTGIFWNWANKTTRLSIQSYYSQSQLLISDTIINNFQSFNFQFNISHKKGLQSTMMANSTFTTPGIDSLQMKGCQINLGKTSPLYQWWISGKYFLQQNGAFRRGTQISVSSKLSRKTRTTLAVGFDEYYKVWGLQYLQPAFTANVKLNISI